MQRFLRSAAVTFVLCATLAVLAAAAQAAPAGGARLGGSVPSWAKAGALKSAASPSAPVSFDVYLGWRHDSSAVALARAVSDPVISPIVVSNSISPPVCACGSRCCTLMTPAT